jgi:hypothetical protein
MTPRQPDREPARDEEREERGEVRIREERHEVRLAATPRRIFARLRPTMRGRSVGSRQSAASPPPIPYGVRR